MSNNSTRIKQVFFIDSAVPDSDVIVANLATDAVYYRLDASQDGLQQIADSLAGYSDLDAIQVISHGSPGSLQLGNGVVTQATLDDHSAALSTIGNALSETGDLLLYGCEVAQGDVGQAFIQQLAAVTGADVAASTNLTGAQAQGGDWTLEASTSSIEAAPLDVGSDYGSILDYSSNSNYDIAVAADLAGLSVASYLTGDALKTQVANLGWTFVKELHVTSTVPVIDANAVIVERTLGDKHEMAIAFRGTAGTTDILTDASAYGFSAYYKALRPQIEVAVIQAVQQHYDNIYITGHSLGGAAAQIAMIDMLEPNNLSVWTDLLGYADIVSPLQVGDRFLDSGISSFTADDWNWLRTHLHGVTFGAPSISTDPHTLPGSRQLNSEFSLDKYNDKSNGLLFQFEHKSNTTGLSNDPIASLGLDELGSLVSIELSDEMGNRYWELGGGGVGGIKLHSSAAYFESLLRLLSNATLLDPSNNSASLPSLSTFVGIGSSANDLVQPDSAGNAVGHEGNDILVASAARNYQFNGGSGDDAYTITDYGINATISGPVGEHLDRLYFNLLGQVSAHISDEDLVVSIDSQGKISTATITGWYSQTNNYQLGEIAKLRPIIGNYWDKEVLNFNNLDIPLFNIGTSQNDIIIGSFSADTMTGFAGEDNLDGRDGNGRTHWRVRGRCASW